MEVVRSCSTITLMIVCMGAQEGIVRWVKIIHILCVKVRSIASEQNCFF